MSEQKEINAFIKNVHLKGYKSVKDLSVRLNNGLNIIIGPNGSGKTNFVEFLSAVLEYNNNSISKQRYSASILIKSAKKDFEIKEIYETNKENFELGISSKSIKSIVVDKENINISSEIEFSFQIFSISRWIKIKPTKILFKIPEDFGRDMLSDLGQFHVSGKFDIVEADFLASVFENNLFQFTYNLIVEENRKIEKKDILKMLEFNSSLLENLNRFSPIKNIKLIDALSFYADKDSIKVNNLKLEFYVNNKWLTWSELSDGTRRIFHIISEINHNNGIIFLEEPENGVHPDQLQLLLDFLLEQSKTKQIILTTHAPEVLNILHEDELDKIIVTRFDENTGTQMHHLSEKQKKKGKAYMKNVGYLSMFWAYSSLEKYVPEEHE